MAFNPDPKVAAARDFAKKFGKSHVVILALDVDNETMEYASYGRNSKECSEAEKVANACYDAAYKYLETQR